MPGGVPIIPKSQPRTPGVRRIGTSSIPARGVLPLPNDQLFDAIDRVAIQHLNLGPAVREQL